ncbi:hypothetical protein HELRODRAFT_125222, partial [Helobdella robusta]|uniref:Uncharacterized protein n=1 Tax=Helobdella robusta TaxID=6412 RepID=T1EH51_HELRO
KVTVGPLPQRFLVKFVGSRPCSGLWGSKHTREPVDNMVQELRQMDKKDDLPLINFKIQEDGIKMAVHPKSCSSKKFSECTFIPLHFISYAVQDYRYSKLFVFILVREMSSKIKVTECHAYLCDGMVSCRQMSLSMADAFKKLELRVKD